MITVLRYATKYAQKTARWAFFALFVAVIAIFSIRVLLPFFGSVEPFSQWKIFEIAQENTTIINNREEVVIRDDDRLDRVVANARNSVVHLLARDETLPIGQNVTFLTGVVVTSDGLIVTSLREDVKNREKLEYSAITFDGTLLDAEYYSYDTFTELLYLRIPENALSPLSFANSDDFSAGRKVVALETTPAPSRNALYLGVITTFDPYMSIASQTLASTEKLQGVFDVSFLGEEVRPGSGVLSYTGELVGIVGEKNVGTASLSYVIDSNTIRESLDRAMASPERSSVFFGASYTPLSSSLARSLDMSTDEGAWLAFPDRTNTTVTLYASPAQQTGLRYGDIIVSVDDVPVTYKNPLSNILHAYEPGDEITLSVIRGEQVLSLTTMLEVLPETR